ncbi:MAG: rhodanese-related sulfurtransferase [Candidatus Moraniibacteriota bacterium]
MAKNPEHKLRNHLSYEDAQKRLASEPFSRRVVSFYRYVHIADPQALRHALYTQWLDLGALGRIYLSEEGINAQMSVPEPAWEAFVEQLSAWPEFAGVPLKIAVEQRNDAFWKLIIRVRKQIVADGLEVHEYDVTNVGTHLSAREWNTMLEQGATAVDMRNNYESVIGRFEGALTPDAETFREELPLVKEMLAGKEEEPVLLYCTGGIRCEKASAYLRHHGFARVYQLHGGIIDYKRQIEEEGLESKFKGRNFVFDGRLAERITEDVLGECRTCGASCDEYTNCPDVKCNRLFLQCAQCQARLAGCCSESCQQVVTAALFR